MSSQRVAAIDIGSARIRAAIARVEPSSQAMTLLGWAATPSAGIVQGHVVDVDATQRALQAAVQLAEDAAGEHMGRTYVGISGSHLQSVVSSAVLPLSGSRQITGADMQKVLQQVRQIQLKENCQMVDTLAGAWTLDGRIRVKDPTGMQATSLGLETLVISGHSAAIGNWRRCLAAIDVEVQELVVSSLAERRTALTPEEEHMGVALVNLGAGTTDLVVVQNGQVQFVHALDYGGANFTQELAALMHCPWEEAERVKCAHGAALPTAEPKTAIRALAFGDQGEVTFSSRFLSEILSARLQKLWDELDSILRHAGLRNSLTAGLVLTGGGSRLSRLHDSCRTHFKLPVRRAESPRNLTIHSLPDGVAMATHGTLLGLLHRGAAAAQPPKRPLTPPRARTPTAPHPLRRLLARFLPGNVD